MKNLFKILSVAVIAAFMSGCCNFMLHKEGDAEIYGGTRYQWKLVKAPFNGKNTIVAEMATFFYPFVIVDLPCEVVFDTLTLPLDCWQTWERNKHGKRNMLCAPKNMTDEEADEEDVKKLILKSAH